jgi:hypothetical protein
LEFCLKSFPLLLDNIKFSIYTFLI